jgi:hypothetical protein
VLKFYESSSQVVELTIEDPDHSVLLVKPKGNGRLNSLVSSLSPSGRLARAIVDPSTLERKKVKVKMPK